MNLFTQSRFPSLWRFFQYWIGGTVDKRNLCILRYDGRSSVLEVGCSLGNIAKVFDRFDDIEYTGIDIDPIVIEYARKSFASHDNFTFICGDLRDYSIHKVRYGYVLFAGICHHLDDVLLRDMLVAVRQLVAPEGKLVVVDPLLPRRDDSSFLHNFLRLEQGRYLRTGSALRALLKEIQGFHELEAEEHLIGCSPFHRPICARFGVYTLKPI